MKPKILGASLGTCVHVAGIINFLRLAQQEGYETYFLGPAISPRELVEAILKYQPQIVGVSYRLTPEVAKNLFQELREQIKKVGIKGKKFIFGGTPPVAKVAQESGLFEAVFTGLESIEEIISYLRGKIFTGKVQEIAHNLIERIKQKTPFPLIRHHFGLPSLEDTIRGAGQIAEAKILDVLSLGPDQNAQESFFRPHEIDPQQSGAGGVPLRKSEDLEAIYQATRTGNFPLVRCYSGTRDLIKWAEMLVRTIHNAWAAIPLCWYNQLDGRSSREPEEAIAESQEAIRWYAQRGIPVEVNEAHQWSLRDAHDSMAVTMAFLAAYNAKKLGVSHYVAQYMLNTPPGTSPAMDLAKMLAKIELIESLHDESFKSFRQIRAGLASLSSDLLIAKGQLAASVQLGLHLNPHIVHVVGYSEGNHAATPEEIIESCKIARGVIERCLLELPEIKSDEKILKRKEKLIRESRVILQALKNLGGDHPEPWCDPKIISRAIKSGILDAPHLRGNKYAAGKIHTRIIAGACHAYDPEKDRIITEKERLVSWL